MSLVRKGSLFANDVVPVGVRESLKAPFLVTEADGVIKRRTSLVLLRGDIAVIPMLISSASCDRKSECKESR